MSTWRRLAIEQFPELRKALMPVENTVELYFELSGFLQSALKSGDDAMVQRVIAYALWGTRQTRDERFVHGTYDLFRPIVQSPSLRATLWRQLTPSQFRDLKTYFHNSYSISPQASLKELEQEYRFTPRPNNALEGGRAKKRRAAQRKR
jgi:hypothetical protein